MKRSNTAYLATASLVLVSLVAIAMNAILRQMLTSPWSVGNEIDVGPISLSPIDPLSNDVWLKEGKNRYLRFQRNAENDAFKSYDIDHDQWQMFSISPDFVVGSFPTQEHEHVLVPGKLNPNGSIQFDSESRLVLPSEDWELYPSSFGNGLFCCFLEHFSDGAGPHEIVSIQLDIGSAKPKFEVKSRLEFEEGVDNRFLFQTSKKNTLVLFSKLYHEPGIGRLHLVSVSLDGALVAESISGFKSTLETLQNTFWIDVSEDGRWIATTEVTSELNEKGEFVLIVMLSEISEGRIVSQHEKRFSFKPVRKSEFGYSLGIPIRFENNHSLLVATPIGWGRLEFTGDNKSILLDELQLTPFPGKLVATNRSGLLRFSGIVESNGAWFAVRSHEISADFVVKTYGKESFVMLPLAEAK